MRQSPLIEHADPRWGSENRPRKAEAIWQTLLHFAGPEIADGDWVDIGCGSGLIAATLAPRVRSMLGVDSEPWARWNALCEQHPNLRLLSGSAEDLHPVLADASADIVICNQVYEHVIDPQRLIDEIRRILKPRGYCYFAGPNLLFPIEPHVFWPFVHWLPRHSAQLIMKHLGAKNLVDAYSKDYWTLQRWLHGFEVTNSVPYILRNPALYHRSGLVWRVLSLIPAVAIHRVTFLSPGFVFVLRK